MKILAFLIAVVAHAQPAFEVASIRTRIGVPSGPLMDYRASGSRLTLVGYQQKGLIREAYNLEFYEIVLPASLADDSLYFNIVAKAPGDNTPSRAEFRLMLQTLLAERCNLRFHRESREMNVYALIVGKGGPKFKPSAPDAKQHWLTGVNGRNQSITATAYTMAELARGIRNSLGVDRPVTDKTDLTGEYDFRLEATLAYRTPEFGDLSVFTAVKEQLGLELQPRKAPVEVLVVDRFDRPSAN